MTPLPATLAKVPAVGGNADRWTIQTLLLTLVLAALAPVAALLAYSGYDSYRQAGERAAQSAYALAQVAADSVEAMLDRTRQLMVKLGERGSIRAMDPARCDPLFADFKTLYPQLASFDQIDLQGRIACSSQPQRTGSAAATADPGWLKALDSGQDFVIGAPQAGSDPQQTVVVLAHPVRDDSGRRIGAIRMAIDLVHLQPVVGARRLPQNTMITIIDHQGTVVARSHDAARFVGTRPGSPIIEIVLARTDGTALSNNLEGVHRVFGFVPVLGTDWYAVAGLSSDSVFADARQEAARNAGLGALILLFATALALALRRRITRPINALRSVAQRVGQGEVTARAPTRGPAEVAEVALQFNAMLDARADHLNALANREADFRMLFDSSLESILRTRPEGHIVAANPAAFSMFGQQRVGEWVGANLAEVAENSHTRWVDLVALGEPRLKPLWQAQQRHGHARGELTMQRADGSRFECAVSMSSFTAADGSTGCTLFLRDLSERLQVETLRADKAAAELANREKSVFLARMSHELRTPLNAILGFAQLLETEPVVMQAPRILDMVGHVRNAGDHLLALIDEVLDLSRIEAGALSLSPEPLDLERLLRECLALTESMAASRRVELAVTPHADPDALDPLSPAGYWIRADRTRVRQVLLNLISNAVKYNRDGGRVGIALSHDQGRVQVVIEDTGWGLNPEQVGNLFQPFNRLGAEGSTVEGTGLGLVIVRQLLQVMSGEITVASTPGVGTRFTLLFPAVATPAGRTSIAIAGSDSGSGSDSGANPEADALAAQGDAAGRPPTWGTVLYVEDHAPNIDLVRAMLALRPQVRLLTETDGEAGLAAALRHPPHLILLDVNLPKMDGYEVLRRLRLDPRTAAIPCIALTANASAGEAARARLAGFVAHVVKPFSLQELLLQIDEQLPASST